MHVDYLADDSLEGREPGTRGGLLAGDYLRDQLEALGLSAAGPDGGFFQPFEAGRRNVLAMVEGSDPQLKHEVVVVCAHYDHVGYGTEENSAGPIGQVHNGADDNASGTSALLELAGAFARLSPPPKRSILMAFFDGEEAGMHGSRHWVAQPTVPLERVVAAVNLDMVGRLRDNRLTVYGSRTGYGLRRLVSRQNEETALSIDFSWELEDDADHYTFFRGDVPVLFFHTGLHDEFHSPKDDAHLIDSQGMGRVTRLAFAVVCELAQRDTTSEFRQAAGSETEDLRQKLAEYEPKLPDRLGAKWPQQAASRGGVWVSHVAAGSPAAKAGIRRGDRVVRFAGHEIEADDELATAVLFASHEVPVTVRRPRQRDLLDLTVELDGSPIRLGITWRADEAEPGTVVLTHVVSGSPAFAGGLRSGDRVYRIDGRDFTADAFVEMVNRPSAALALLVERDGQIFTAVLRFDSPAKKQAA